VTVPGLYKSPLKRRSASVIHTGQHDDLNRSVSNALAPLFKELRDKVGTTGVETNSETITQFTFNSVYSQETSNVMYVIHVTICICLGYYLIINTSLKLPIASAIHIK
jgi:hypothetical protein